MHGHGKSRWQRGGGIQRSIHVTITLNSVCPLVHRRAGTRTARTFSYDDRFVRVRRSSGSRRSHSSIVSRTGGTVTLAQVSSNRTRPSNAPARTDNLSFSLSLSLSLSLFVFPSTKVTQVSSSTGSIIFIYTLSQIIHVVGASIEHFLILWLRHSLLITDPRLFFPAQKTVRSSEETRANTQLVLHHITSSNHRLEEILTPNPSSLDGRRRGKRFVG